jgi:hypothetical protein
MIKDNHNTKADLMIELKTLVKLIELDPDQKRETKLALNAILLILQLI